MKRIIYLLLLLLPFMGNSQLVGPRYNFTPTFPVWEWYVTNSPGSAIGTSRVVMWVQDSTRIHWRLDSFGIASLSSSVNHGTPNGVLWTDASGIMRRSPIASVATALGFTPKRVETYLGTTDGSGNYTVTYGTAFASVPDVQPQLQAGTTSQVVRITSSTTTGFTVQVTNRSSVTLLAVEVLLAATTPVSGASVGVLVTQR